MKQLIALLIFCFLIQALAHSQIQQKLTPARGHYKQLEAFSGLPKSSSEEMDKKRFESAKETVDYRMSLKPVYLTNISLDDFKLPDVPANSSKRTEMDIAYLLDLQKHRTKEDVRSSLYMANIWYNPRLKPSDSAYTRLRPNLFFIGRSIGTWFNPETLPVTADFMGKVWQDASYFIWSLKFKYARIRPYVINSAVKNLEVTDWAAYPSGHAANSYINAFIYSELAPEFTDCFVKDAYDMAHSREIIGVHYPSDSEASRIFARQFVNMLFRNKTFLADFELVKIEWSQKAKENFGK